MAKFEKVKCNLCGQDKTKTIAVSYDRLHPQNKGTFTMVRCTNCGLLYQNPRPTQDTAGEFYPEGEYYSFNSKKSFFLNSLEKAILNQYGHTRSKTPQSLTEKLLGALVVQRVGIPLFEKGKTILDVGAGDGFVLSVLKKIGWETYGTEVSQEAVKAGEKHGVKMYLGQLEEIDFKGKKFDYIRMSHSLEHLPDPKRSLKLISSLLKPGGQLIILVPNYNSPAARVLGKRWLGLDLPRHLYVFTPPTITKLLKEADLKVTKIKQFGAKGTLGGLTFTINDLSRALRKKNIDTQKMLTNQYLAGIDLLIHYSTSLVNIGDNMEVWATKK